MDQQQCTEDEINLEVEAVEAQLTLKECFALPEAVLLTT
jgi:hypothetical protein